MIGYYYFSIKILIYQQYPGTDNLWIAKVEFEDLGHAQLGSMKGSLSTKYRTNLLDSVKTVDEDARKLGISSNFLVIGIGYCLILLIISPKIRWHIR